MGIIGRIASRIGVGRLNPRGPNKFEPTTRAKPAPDAVPGRYSGKERRDDAAAAKKRREQNN